MKIPVQPVRLAAATFLALMVGLAGVCSAAPPQDVGGAIGVSPQVKPPKAPKAPKAPKVPKAPKPDVKAPKVKITSPSEGETVVGTVTVTARAKDKGGVTGVQFLLDGAPLGGEIPAAPFEIPWDTLTVADGPHTLGADARDAAGNVTSDSVTVTVVNAAPAPARLEETAAIAEPAGAWEAATPADTGAPLSGDAAAFSGVGGATVTFTFTGTGVSWLGLLCGSCGIATIHLDGQLVEAVDTFDAIPTPGVMFETSALAAGDHTLVIQVTGTQNGAATGSLIVVDAFDATP